MSSVSEEDALAVVAHTVVVLRFAVFPELPLALFANSFATAAAAAGPDFPRPLRFKCDVMESTNSVRDFESILSSHGALSDKNLLYMT